MKNTYLIIILFIFSCRNQNANSDLIESINEFEQSDKKIDQTYEPLFLDLSHRYSKELFNENKKKNKNLITVVR